MTKTSPKFIAGRNVNSGLDKVKNEGKKGKKRKEKIPQGQ
jgi:hypothetical protein